MLATAAADDKASSDENVTVVKEIALTCRTVSTVAG